MNYSQTLFPFGGARRKAKGARRRAQGLSVEDLTYSHLSAFSAFPPRQESFPSARCPEPVALRLPMPFLLLLSFALLLWLTWTNPGLESGDRNSFPGRRQGGHCLGDIPPGEG